MRYVRTRTTSQTFTSPSQLGIEEGEDDDEGNHTAVANDVKHGDYISELPVPTYGTHTFQGWWTGFTVNDGQFTTLTSVTKDLDLVARWSDLTVTYIDGNGDVFTTQGYAAGQPLVYPSGTPLKNSTADNDFNFVGWNVPENTPVSYDFTVTAVYDTMATVTFKDGDGSDLLSDYYVAGSLVDFDGSEPTKASSGDYDYNFNGKWFTDPELQNEFDLDEDVINVHTTLYPGFDASYKGLFSYTLDEDTMTAQITGLNSVVADGYTDTVASIPDTIKSGMKTYTVTSIAANAFRETAFPASVTIVSFNDAKHLVDIGQYAFYYLSDAKATYAVGKLPDTITNVGQAAFHYVKTTNNPLYGSLLDLEDTHLTEIKPYAFSFILEGDYVEFTLPESVTKIGAYAFQTCQKASGQIADLSHVTNLGNYAFYGAYNLSGVVNLSGITTVPVGCFDGGSGFGHLTGVILNEDTTIIGNSAFRIQYQIKFVSGTSSLTAIGEQAFGSCSGLKSFFIPASCTTIGAKAFQYAMATDGIIYCAVTSDLYNWASDWHSNLYGTIIYNAITSGSYEYSANATIDYIIRPDESVVITGYTGTEQTIDLKDGMEIDGKTYFVQEIGARAFQNNTSLKTINIRTAKKSYDPLIIGDYAFAGCTALNMFRVNGLNTVSNNAWGSNLYLSVGAHAFDGDATLHFYPLTQDGGQYGLNKFCLDYIGDYAFAGCTAMSYRMTLRNNVGKNAFDGCTALAGFDLAATDTVLTIGEYAFNGCTNIARVDILANWKVDSYAFNGCTGLGSVWIKSGAVMSGDWIFCSVGDGLIIHCNDASAPDSWGANWNYNALGDVHNTSYGESF